MQDVTTFSYFSSRHQFQNLIVIKISVLNSHNESICSPGLPLKKFDIDRKLQNIVNCIKYY